MNQTMSLSHFLLNICDMSCIHHDHVIQEHQKCKHSITREELRIIALAIRINKLEELSDKVGYTLTGRLRT